MDSPFFSLYFLRDLRFSYGFVAALGMISASSDVFGMPIWGRISDRAKNKPVVRLSAHIAVFLPLAWVTVRQDSVVMPIILNFIGGSFWAGINLCINNLVLNISPHENRASYFSCYNVMAGLGAASGPILAGLVLKSMPDAPLRIMDWEILPLQIIFMTSALFRFLSLQLFKRVHEPEAVSVGQMVRIIRSVRGLNVASGFNFLLHPFIEISKVGRETKDKD